MTGMYTQQRRIQNLFKFFEGWVFEYLILLFQNIFQNVFQNVFQHEYLIFQMSKVMQWSATIKTQKTPNRQLHIQS